MYTKSTSIVIACFFRTIEERRNFVTKCKTANLDIFSQGTIFIRHEPESKRFKVVLFKPELKANRIKLRSLLNNEPKELENA